MSEALFHVLDKGPAMVAPYSHAVEVDGWLFVTGQMPIGADGIVPEGIEAQTRVVLENLKSVLERLGSNLREVVSARVFLTDFEAHYERMNKVYASYFEPGRFPARTCVGVTGLARGCQVEIDFIARRAR
ncbi:MAG TPA: RidA family protein [Burkholderiales bacterium]|jgi:reactive intermediate/imine deaminase|nr:RidA family protein [Burkholderiales bacterium]